MLCSRKSCCVMQLFLQIAWNISPCYHLDWNSNFCWVFGNFGQVYSTEMPVFGLSFDNYLTFSLICRRINGPNDLRVHWTLQWIRILVLCRTAVLFLTESANEQKIQRKLQCHTAAQIPVYAKLCLGNKECKTHQMSIFITISQMKAFK